MLQQSQRVKTQTQSSPVLYTQLSAAHYYKSIYIIPPAVQLLSTLWQSSQGLLNQWCWWSEVLMWKTELLKQWSRSASTHFGVKWSTQLFFFSPSSLKVFFGALCAFINRTAEGLNRKWGWERGNDMQQRATGWNQSRGSCNEDKTSVHGAPALPTEPLGRLHNFSF